MKIQSQSQGIITVKVLQLPIPKRRYLWRTGKKLHGHSFQINLLIPAVLFSKEPCVNLALSFRCISDIHNYIKATSFVADLTVKARLFS